MSLLISFSYSEKMLKQVRGVEQRPLMLKIRQEGAFKNIEHVKTPDKKKPRYNLICIGSTKDAKNRIVISEKSQPEQTWATMTLVHAWTEVQKKMKMIASNQLRHKRMLTMSSAHFTFECQSQIKRQIKIFDDSICSEQDISSMPNHQIRFDDGIFFLLSLITLLFNHGSQLDPHQLVNILLPFSKNADRELGRLCTIQSAHAYLDHLLDTLRFVFAISKRINSIIKDANDTLGHMDVCQGKALFEVLSNHNPNSNKGRNEIFKLIFDKKVGAIGGIYDDSYEKV